MHYFQGNATYHLHWLSNCALTLNFIKRVWAILPAGFRVKITSFVMAW